MLRAGAFFSRGVSLLPLFAGLGRLFDVRQNDTWLHTSACFFSLYDSPRGVFASGMGMVGKVDIEFSPLSFVTALVKEKGGPGGPPFHLSSSSVVDCTHRCCWLEAKPGSSRPSDACNGRGEGGRGEEVRLTFTFWSCNVFSSGTF